MVIFKIMDETPTIPGKSLLLIDDDQFITIAYKDGLEGSGYIVEVASDGLNAFEKLNTFKPDLILLELINPRMNGFEFLQKIKSNKALQNIPVLVLTNLSQDSDRQEAKEYGAVDFLVKSDVSLKDLITKIENILG